MLPRKLSAVGFLLNLIPSVSMTDCYGSYRVRYSLPSRELITRCCWSSHQCPLVDGVFLFPTAIRLHQEWFWQPCPDNVPAVFCSGGPMKGVVLTWQGIRRHSQVCFEAVGTYQAGDMSMDELDFLEKMPAQLVVLALVCLLPIPWTVWWKY